MKKWLIMMVAMVATCSGVYAQDVDTQLLNLKNDVAAKKSQAQSQLIATADGRQTMISAQQIDAVCYQILLPQNDLTDLPGYELTNVRQFVSTSEEYLTVHGPVAQNVSEMCEEWNMDPNDPYTQMMLQYMQGPFYHESLIARRERLWYKGSYIGNQAMNRDADLAQVEASRQTYKYGLSQLDPNDSNYASYSMMYLCMIEWCEDSLFDGYAKSYSDWDKANECFYQSRLTMETMQSMYDNLCTISSLIP